MADFVFTSPGVKFKERDLTYVTRNVGITTLGVAGETLKGPAFEPVFIQDQTQFADRFGAQSTKRFPNGQLQYQLPYVANAFLEEAQQLYVTRVLGLSGYQAGLAWNLTVSAGIDPDTEGIESVAAPVTVPFSGNSYLGVALGSSGATGVSDTGFTKNVLTGEFTNYVHAFTATTYTASTQSGEVSDVVTLYSGTSLSDYEGMVVAVIRSRGDSEIGLDSVAETTFDTDTLEMVGNSTLTGVGDLFGSFTLEAASTATTAQYQASLNPDDSNFLPNVIGYGPKDKSTMIWTQAIYPDLIKKLDEEGYAYGVNTEMVTGVSTNFTDYGVGYQTPETPWVVSQLKGNTLDRLFKLISISDGDSANEEIKVTIGNINPGTLEFDVVVRSFYDTDANPIVLETYQKCTMIKGASSYIGQRIGTSDGEYTLKSDYIMVEVADEVPLDVFPAGFEGYMFNDYVTGITGSVTGVAPAMFYKTEYEDTDKVNKTYLGISELGYTGDGINQNMFDFNNWYSGQDADEFSKSKGFHMDSGATGTTLNGEFEVGAGQFRTV